MMIICPSQSHVGGRRRHQRVYCGAQVRLRLLCSLWRDKHLLRALELQEAREFLFSESVRARRTAGRARARARVQRTAPTHVARHLILNGVYGWSPSTRNYRDLRDSFTLY